MTDSTEDFLMKSFRESVERLVISVKEMIAASKLLRARVESNDDVMKNFEGRMRSMWDRLNEFDQRLTALENQYHHHRHPGIMGGPHTQGPL